MSSSLANSWSGNSSPARFSATLCRTCWSEIRISLWNRSLCSWRQLVLHFSDSDFFQFWIYFTDGFEFSLTDWTTCNYHNKNRSVFPRAALAWRARWRSDDADYLECYGPNTDNSEWQNLATQESNSVHAHGPHWLARKRLESITTRDNT